MGKFMFLVACLLLSACTKSASSSDSADACALLKLNPKVIGGKTCGGLDRAAVVRVAAIVSSAGQGVAVPLCSGAMISARDVLTATHCFLRDEIEGQLIAGYGILVGEADSLHLIAADGVNFAPGFRESNARLFNDAAVLHLAEAADLDILPILGSREPVVAENAYVYGYGLRSTSSQEADFAKLEGGEMSIADVTPNHVFVVYSGSGVNVCNGDSGGPILVEVNGAPAIAGVVSMGSVQGCQAGDVTTFTNLQSASVFNWLTSRVPAVQVK